MKNNNKNKGFSLVELLIYIGIFAASATFLVGVLVIFTRVQVSQSSMNAVNSQVSFVNSFVQERVRSSSLIDMPAGVSTSTLTLRMASSTLDPTLIYWDEGNQAVLLKEGAGDPSALTDSSVNVTNFSVIKYTNPGGHDVAQISMSIDFDTENDRAKYQRSVQTSISRVSAATFDSDGLPNANDTFDLGNATYKWRNIYLSNDAYIDGNVGIGTTTPSVRLHINEASTSKSGAIINTQATSSSYYITDFQSAGSSKVYIRSDGNVGIGTNSPTKKIEVVGQTEFGENPGTNDGGWDHIFTTNSGNGLAIFPENYTASADRLITLRSSSGKGRIIIYDGAGNITHSLNANGDSYINTGNVGIGTTAPGYKLDVKGNIVNSVPSMGYIGLTGDLPGYTVNTYPTLKTNYSTLYFSAGGQFSAYMSSNGTWTAYSDRNRKENFVELNPEDVLAKIDEMPMYQWNFKSDDPSIKHIAPIAQDFHSAFGLNGADDKMISHIDPPGVALVGIKALSNKYSDLKKTVEDLIKVTEEQQTEIEELKKEVQELKN